MKQKLATKLKKKRKKRNAFRQARRVRIARMLTALSRERVAEPFRMNGKKFSKEYLHYRNSPHPVAVSARKLCAELWGRFKSYADHDFLKKFREGEMFARFWEMDLACMLLDHGNVLELPKNFQTKKFGAPDLCILNGDSRIWVEAVTPEAGGGEDQVDFLGKGVHGYTPDKVLMRLTQVLSNKLKAYNKYRKDGVIQPDEPYIIAVSTQKISAGVLETDPPLGVKATLGVGSPVLISSGKWFLENKPSVKKSNGAEIPTNPFNTPAYEGVSAALFSRMDMANRSIPNSEIMVMNHNAINPVDRASFPFGWHYWMHSDDELASRPGFKLEETC